MSDPTDGHRSPDPARTPLVGPPPSLGGAGSPPWGAEPRPYVATPPVPRGRRWVPVAAVAAVAVLAGGFGLASVLDGDGADSPEEAVEALFAAVDDEDVIGALEALDPGERGVLVPAIEQVADEARRLELASSGLDLRGVDGVDLVVDGLGYDTERLSDDLVAVDLTGGTVTASADLDALPVGALLREVIDGADEADGVEADVDASLDRLELDKVRLVARRSGGGWYVSAGYSVAEQARLSLDPVPPVPTFGAGTSAVGADGPEAAVRQAVEAAIVLDVERLIELVPPGELPALHDYGPLLVDATEEAGDPDSVVELVDLQMEVSGGPGSTAVVTARSFEVRQTSTWSDQTEVATWSYDGSCLTIDWSYDGRSQGFDDDLDWCGDAAVHTPFPFLFFGGGDVGVVSVVTVEEGGRWYVSPTRSVVELVLGPLRDLDRDDARRIVRWWAGDWWVAEPDEFWEACGVDRPGLDTSSEEGEAAYERCWDQLPRDDEGPWSMGGGRGAYEGAGGVVLEDEGWEGGGPGG